MGFKKRPRTEEEFINASNSEPTKESVSAFASKEATFFINLRVPESLWNRLNYYVENHASRRESKNQVILDALEAHLKNKNM